ncbi:hypothetical protein KM043_017396 [Ampulex compressa]|nr:hypothetical protein KM043_017396 [Ampulex compressa]
MGQRGRVQSSTDTRSPSALVAFSGASSPGSSAARSWREGGREGGRREGTTGDRSGGVPSPESPKPVRYRKGAGRPANAETTRSPASHGRIPFSSSSSSSTSFAVVAFFSFGPPFFPRAVTSSFLLSSSAFANEPLFLTH